MAVRFETVKAGDVLLDVHSERMGNTTMRALGVWPVRVLSVDTAARTARVSWNNNPAQTWYARDFKRVRRFAPEWMPERYASGFRCHHCRVYAPEADSRHHKPDCPHPKAVAHRKRAARVEGGR